MIFIEGRWLDSAVRWCSSVLLNFLNISRSGVSLFWVPLYHLQMDTYYYFRVVTTLEPPYWMLSEVGPNRKLVPQPLRHNPVVAAVCCLPSASSLFVLVSGRMKCNLIRQIWDLLCNKSKNRFLTVDYSILISPAFGSTIHRLSLPAASPCRQS